MHFLKHSFLAKVCIYLMLVLARQFLNKGRSNNSLINVVYKICCGCLNFLIKQSVEFVNLNTQSGLIKGKYTALILQILSMIWCSSQRHIKSCPFLFWKAMTQCHCRLSIKFLCIFLSTLVFDKHFKNRFPAPVTYNVAFYPLNLK